MMIYNFDYRNKSEWPEGEFLKWYISHDENNYQKRASSNKRRSQIIKDISFVACIIAHLTLVRFRKCLFHLI